MKDFCFMASVRRAVAACVAIGLLFVTVSGCVSGSDNSGNDKSENGGNNAVSARDINAVMESHVDELMAVPGVVGVAIGALDDGKPMIRVMVVEKSTVIDEKIPTTLEGYPVRVTVSGEIKPMSGN